MGGILRWVFTSFGVFVRVVEIWHGDCIFRKSLPAAACQNDNFQILQNLEKDEHNEVRSTSESWDSFDRMGQ